MNRRERSISLVSRANKKREEVFRLALAVCEETAKLGTIGLGHNAARLAELADKAQTVLAKAAELKAFRRTGQAE